MITRPPFRPLLLLAAFTLSHAASTARAGTFYVAGSGNGTIQEFSATGTNTGSFPASHLTTPTAQALDSSGNLYVTDDQGSSAIEKFSPAGVDLGTFASTNLTRTYGLAFDSAGNLYAANFGNNTIEKFSPSGTDLGTFIGSGLSGPVGLAFDAAGNLYVANYGSNTIGKFSPAGASLGTFASTGLAVPYALAFDSAGNLYATNIGSNTVERFSPAGTDLGAFARGLSTPTGLTFDGSGNLYVCNETSLVIEKFSAAGVDLGVFGTAPAGSAPASIVYSAAGGTSTAPTSSVVTPLGGLNLAQGSTVIIAAMASSSIAGQPLASVDFYANGVLFASFDGSGNPVAGQASTRRPVPRSAAPAAGTGVVFQAAFQVPAIAQPVAISVVATTAAGAAQTSAPLTIQPVAVTGSQPTVTEGGPASGARVKAGESLTVPVTVSAAASVIANVQYFLNGLQVAVSTAPPFGFDVTPPVAGTYVLTAIATDTAGVSTLSAPTVIQAVPTVSLAVKGDGMAVVGGEKGKVLFTRAGDDLSSALTVYFTAGGTAVNGANYEHLGKKVVIPSGSATYKLKIVPVDTGTGPASLKVTIKLADSPDGSYEPGSTVKAKVLLEQSE